MKEKELQELIICACHSPEHQIIFRTVEGWNEVFMAIHLTKMPFFKRLWHGIKYIFGYKCMFGDFDEVIISPDDVEKFEKVVEWLKTKHEKS